MCAVHSLQCDDQNRTVADTFFVFYVHFYSVSNQTRQNEITCQVGAIAQNVIGRLRYYTLNYARYSYAYSQSKRKLSIWFDVCFRCRQG